MLVLRRREGEGVIVCEAEDPGVAVGTIRVEQIKGGRVRLSFIGFEGRDLVRDEIAGEWKKDAGTRRQEHRLRRAEVGGTGEAAP